MYKIVYGQSIEKDLRALPKKVITQALNKIESILAVNPNAGERLEYRSKKLYRYRVRDYRIIYTINRNNKTIVVYRIRHRKEVYRKPEII